MQKSLHAFLSFIVPLFVLLVGCKNDVADEEKDYFTAYRIEAAFNSDYLNKDIEGKIDGNKIILQLPDGLDLSNLIATFTHSGKEVYVGSVRQVSGQSANDFTKQTTYAIVSKNGTKNLYQTEIQKIDDSGNIFLLFGFLKENNDFLLKDYTADITDGKLEISLPATAKSLAASFRTNAKEVLVNGVPQTDGSTVNDFSKPITYTLVSAQGVKKNYSVSVTWTSSIPHFFVTTDNGAPITSKSVYLYANILIEANGWGDDFEGRTRIRGRGNSTWGMPKKPYRLKLDKNAGLLNLAEEKDWVLLANYIDPTLMLNAVAFKIGELIGLQYTNHSIPVDLTINGIYQGSYMLTEQVEISSSRVNVNKKQGVLLELDTNYDEDFQFISENYRLPVMVKDPDVESHEQFQKIKNDFQLFENLVASGSFPNSGYKDYIDIESLVKYMIVYNLTHNMEINHPKSTYMYKDASGKYFMGPIWDFDWAFNYEGTHMHFGSHTTPLFRKLGSSSTGNTFFSRFLEDPEITRLYRETWAKFHTEKMDVLLKYIDFYALHITESQKNDYQVWKNGTTNFPYKVNQLKNWLKGRANYMDTYVQTFN